MSRHAEVSASRTPDEEVADDEREPVLSHPNVSGDLGMLVHAGPDFAVRRRGYDRLQVDNYVDWTEMQLTTMRRAHEELLDRFGACCAELEITRRQLEEASKGPDPLPISPRMEQMLRLAADEASEMTAAAAEEAERILDDARLEAAARLRKADEIKQAAVAAGDALREEAQRDRDEAAEVLARASRQAEEMIREAEAERDRLAGEVAVARDVLRRLTDQVGRALEAVTAEIPERRVVLTGNVASLT